MHLKAKFSRFCILPILSILFVTLICCFNKDNDTQLIIMESTVGDITIELYPNKAPLTVSNFMQYIENNAYGGATFYRATRPGNDPSISVLQGGLWKPWVEDMVKNYEPAFTPIPHETTQMSGIKHTDGVISMARLDPGTASSEFFICIGDHPSLDFGGDRNKDGQGFAAFGRVTKGMDVVRSIHGLPTANEEGFKGQILVEPIEITNILQSKN